MEVARPGQEAGARPVAATSSPRPRRASRRGAAGSSASSRSRASSSSSIGARPSTARRCARSRSTSTRPSGSRRCCASARRHAARRRSAAASRDLHGATSRSSRPSEDRIRRDFVAVPERFRELPGRRQCVDRGNRRARSRGGAARGREGAAREPEAAPNRVLGGALGRDPARGIGGRRALVAVRSGSRVGRRRGARLAGFVVGIEPGHRLPRAQGRAERHVAELETGASAHATSASTSSRRRPRTCSSGRTRRPSSRATASSWCSGRTASVTYPRCARSATPTSLSAALAEAVRDQGRIEAAAEETLAETPWLSGFGDPVRLGVEIARLKGDLASREARRESERERASSCASRSRASPRGWTSTSRGSRTPRGRSAPRSATSRSTRTP